MFFDHQKRLVFVYFVFKLFESISRNIVFVKLSLPADIFVEVSCKVGKNTEFIQTGLQKSNFEATSLVKNFDLLYMELNRGSYFYT